MDHLIGPIWILVSTKLLKKIVVSDALSPQVGYCRNQASKPSDRPKYSLNITSKYLPTYAH